MERYTNVKVILLLLLYYCLIHSSYSEYSAESFFTGRMVRSEVWFPIKTLLILLSHIPCLDAAQNQFPNPALQLAASLNEFFISHRSWLWCGLPRHAPQVVCLEPHLTVLFYPSLLLTLILISLSFLALYFSFHSITCHSFLFFHSVLPCRTQAQAASFSCNPSSLVISDFQVIPPAFRALARSLLAQST